MSRMLHQFGRLMTQVGAGLDMASIMKSDEIKAGRRVVKPGDEPWLPAEDWYSDVIVSVDGDTVRLVAIRARNPGHGAFRRLIAGIEAAGLKPCVLEPVPEMAATLKRWGWKHRRYGIGIEAEERWRPNRRI